METTSAQSEGSDIAQNPLLIVLSGPSGVGKDAILSRMRELGSQLHFTVTATTRIRRDTEKSGVDYIFLTEDEFRDLRENGGLLEHAEVFLSYRRQRLPRWEPTIRQKAFCARLLRVRS